MKEQKKPTTAVQIREHLRRHGPDYRWHIWHVIHIEQKLSKMKFHSFIAYFKVLLRLNLVLRTSPRAVIKPKVTKYRKGLLTQIPHPIWFKLNPQKLNSEFWDHPLKSLYPHLFKFSGRGPGRPAGSKNRRKGSQGKSEAKQESERYYDL